MNRFSGKYFPLYLSEFIGCFFLIFFGCGAMVMSEVNEPFNGQIIPLVFGAVICVMIYAVGHISGAHFNPAVSIAFCSLKRLSPAKLIGYILSQLLGALAGCLALMLIFGNDHSFGATVSTVNTPSLLIIEFILSFSLMFVITSVATDERAQGQLAGLSIGLTVFLAAAVFGPLTGASMNPARTLAPALFSGELSDLLVYLLASVFGAVSGAKVYEWSRCQVSDRSDNDEAGCC